MFTLRHSIRLTRCLRLSCQYSTAGPSASIQKLIGDSIKATGPISVARYMQMCLSFPDAGYYMKGSNAVFGSSGDFITSPEISQVFGELLGIWMLMQWMDAQKPPHIRLVELGPGRGTLMADMLRTIGQLSPPGVLKSIHLVENSDSMRSMQDQRLKELADAKQCSLHWHDSVADIKPDDSTFTMLVAHEFFDALPINILQKQGNDWHEIKVDVISDEPAPFHFVVDPEPSQAGSIIEHAFPEIKSAPVNSKVELSRSSLKTALEAAKLVQSGGCGLFIDYGRDGPSSDSFRAFKNHEIVDVFHRPGECDLTANVNFSWLRTAMQGTVNVTETLTQSQFLLGMNIGHRMEGLVEKNPTRAEDILKAGTRLVDPMGMGTQYKFMGFRSSKGADSLYPFIKIFPSE